MAESGVEQVITLALERRAISAGDAVRLRYHMTERETVDSILDLMTSQYSVPDDVADGLRREVAAGAAIGPSPSAVGTSSLGEASVAPSRSAPPSTVPPVDPAPSAAPSREAEASATGRRIGKRATETNVQGGGDSREPQAPSSAARGLAGRPASHRFGSVPPASAVEVEEKPPVVPVQSLAARIAMASQSSGPPLKRCVACGAETRHGPQGCTRCAARAEARKGAVLSIVAGVIIIVAGIGLMTIASEIDPHEHQPGVITIRRRPNITSYLIVGAFFAGLPLIGRGVRDLKG